MESMEKLVSGSMLQLLYKKKCLQQWFLLDRWVASGMLELWGQGGWLSSLPFAKGGRR